MRESAEATVLGYNIRAFIRLLKDLEKQRIETKHIAKLMKARPLSGHTVMYHGIGMLNLKLFSQLKSYFSADSFH